MLFTLDQGSRDVLHTLNHKVLQVLHEGHELIDYSPDTIFQ
jgi:hypothetical protein